MNTDNVLPHVGLQSIQLKLIVKPQVLAQCLPLGQRCVKTLWLLGISINKRRGEYYSLRLYTCCNSEASITKSVEWLCGICDVLLLILKNISFEWFSKSGSFDVLSLALDSPLHLEFPQALAPPTNYLLKLNF